MRDSHKTTMNKRPNHVIRVISAVLATTFLWNEIAFAAPDFKPSQFELFGQAVVDLKFPLSVAAVDEVYKGSGEKTVILIQDAHTNETAQINVSKALDVILEKANIRYVFLEAGTEDASLAFLKDKAPLEQRERVGLSYLKKGELRGSEYLNLVSDRDFVLWGVENKDLYLKALEAYQTVAATREQYQDYLKRVGVTVDTLKPKIFNPSLLSFDKQHESYLSEKISLTDYLEVLIREAQKRNISLDAYPHLKSLKSVREKEKNIDFEKANQEQIRAVSMLSADDLKGLKEASEMTDRSPFKISSRDHKEQKAFYALLEEKLDDTQNLYPELFKYFAYLKEARKIEAQGVLDEEKALEGEVYGALIRTEDERKLHQVSKNLRYLVSLLNLQLTPSEFEEYRADPQGFDIVQMTGFLNKKIMDLKKQYERVVFLERGYENAARRAEDFYLLTYERDQAFVRNMLQKMREEKEDKAVLIMGGYHSPNVKALLKEANISYVTVSPQIFRETNHKRYEKILFSRAPVTNFSPVSRPVVSGAERGMDAWALEQSAAAKGFNEAVAAMGAYIETHPIKLAPAARMAEEVKHIEIRNINSKRPAEGKQIRFSIGSTDYVVSLPTAGTVNVAATVPRKGWIFTSKDSYDITQIARPADPIPGYDEMVITDTQSLKDFNLAIRVSVEKGTLQSEKPVAEVNYDAVPKSDGARMAQGEMRDINIEKNNLLEPRVAPAGLIGAEQPPVTDYGTAAQTITSINLHSTGSSFVRDAAGYQSISVSEVDARDRVFEEQADDQAYLQASLLMGLASAPSTLQDERRKKKNDAGARMAHVKSLRPEIYAAVQRIAQKIVAVYENQSLPNRQRVNEVLNDEAVKKDLEFARKELPKKEKIFLTSGTINKISPLLKKFKEGYENVLPDMRLYGKIQPASSSTIRGAGLFYDVNSPSYEEVIKELLAQDNIYWSALEDEGTDGVLPSKSEVIRRLKDTQETAQLVIDEVVRELLKQNPGDSELRRAYQNYRNHPKDISAAVALTKFIGSVAVTGSSIYGSVVIPPEDQDVVVVLDGPYANQLWQKLKVEVHPKSHLRIDISIVGSRHFTDSRFLEGLKQRDRELGSSTVVNMRLVAVPVWGYWYRPIPLSAKNIITKSFNVFADAKNFFNDNLYRRSANRLINTGLVLNLGIRRLYDEEGEVGQRVGPVEINPSELLGLIAQYQGREVGNWEASENLLDQIVNLEKAHIANIEDKGKELENYFREKVKRDKVDIVARTLLGENIDLEKGYNGARMAVQSADETGRDTPRSVVAAQTKQFSSIDEDYLASVIINSIGVLPEGLEARSEYYETITNEKGQDKKISRVKVVEQDGEEEIIDATAGGMTRVGLGRHWAYLIPRILDNLEDIHSPSGPRTARFLNELVAFLSQIEIYQHIQMKFEEYKKKLESENQMVEFGLLSLSQVPSQQYINDLYRLIYEVRTQDGQEAQEALDVLKEILPGKLFYIQSLFSETTDTLDNLQNSLIEPQKMQIAVAVSRGIDFLHSIGILHRDIKLSNILVDVVEVDGVETGEIRVTLIDYGLSLYVPTPGDSSGVHARYAFRQQLSENMVVGTYQYMSPEAAGQLSTAGNERSDWAAYWISMLELFGLKPFKIAKPTYEDFIARNYLRSAEDIRKDIQSAPSSELSDKTKAFLNRFQFQLSEIKPEAMKEALHLADEAVEALVGSESSQDPELVEAPLVGARMALALREEFGQKPAGIQSGLIKVYAEFAPTDRAGQEGRDTFRLFEIYDVDLGNAGLTTLLKRIENPDYGLFLVAEEDVQNWKTTKAKITVLDENGQRKEVEASIANNAAPLVEGVESPAENILSKVTTGTVRVSSAGLARIPVQKDGKTYYVLALNKDARTTGKYKLAPLGGAVGGLTPAGLAVLRKFGVQTDDFEGVQKAVKKAQDKAQKDKRTLSEADIVKVKQSAERDLRFTLPTDRLEDYVQWFNSRKDRETNVARELGEELVDEQKIMNWIEWTWLSGEFAFKVIDAEQSMVSAITEALQNAGAADISYFQSAYDFARANHEKAKNWVRDDSRVYIWHPLEIAYYTVVGLGITDKPTILAALFHDLPEDTPADEAAIREFLKDKATPDEIEKTIQLISDLTENTSYRSENKKFEEPVPVVTWNFDGAEKAKIVGRLATKIEHLYRVAKSPRFESAVLKIIDRLQNLFTNEVSPKKRDMDLLEIKAWRNFLELKKEIIAKNLSDQINRALDYEEQRLTLTGARMAVENAPLPPALIVVNNLFKINEAVAPSLKKEDQFVIRVTRSGFDYSIANSETGYKVFSPSQSNISLNQVDLSFLGPIEVRIQPSVFNLTQEVFGELVDILTNLKAIFDKSQNEVDKVRGGFVTQPLDHLAVDSHATIFNPSDAVISEDVIGSSIEKMLGREAFSIGSLDIRSRVPKDAPSVRAQVIAGARMALEGVSRNVILPFEVPFDQQIKNWETALRLGQVQKRPIRRILVVEDEEIVRNMVVMVIKRHFTNLGRPISEKDMTVAAGEEEALKAIELAAKENNLYDFYYEDKDTPVQGAGLKVVQAVRKLEAAANLPPAKIVVTSGRLQSTQENAEILEINLGSFGKDTFYLEKPFPRPLGVSSITKLIDLVHAESVSQVSPMLSRAPSHLKGEPVPVEIKAKDEEKIDLTSFIDVSEEDGSRILVIKNTNSNETRKGRVSISLQALPELQPFYARSPESRDYGRFTLRDLANGQSYDFETGEGKPAELNNGDVDLFFLLEPGQRHELELLASQKPVNAEAARLAEGAKLSVREVIQKDEKTKRAVEEFVLQILSTKTDAELGSPFPLTLVESALVLRIDVDKSRNKVDLKVLDRQTGKEVETALSIEKPFEKLVLIRNRHPEYQEAYGEMSVQGFLALLRIDRMQVEGAVLTESRIPPFTLEMPATLFDNAKTDADFESAAGMAMAQILDLKRSPRYSAMKVYFGTDGVDEARAAVINALVDANIQKGHVFLEKERPAKGLLVKVIDTEAKGDEKIDRDGRTLTYPVGKFDKNAFSINLNEPLVITAATASIYGREGVFDQKKQEINAAAVSAVELERIAPYYGQRIDEEARASFDAPVLQKLLTVETKRSVFKKFAHLLSPITKLLNKALVNVARVLQAVGGAA